MHPQSYVALLHNIPRSFPSARPLLSLNVAANTPNMIAVQGTTASKTAGQGCTLVGAGGGANIQASAEL